MSRPSASNGTLAVAAAAPVATRAESSPRAAVYRDIARHWATYACGALTGSLASILLLPFYTRFLTSAEYGLIAVLDVTMNLLTAILTATLVSAITRWSSEAATADERARVTGTAVTFIAVVGGAGVTAGQFASPALAAFTLGTAEYAHYYRIMLVTMLVNVLGTVAITQLVAMRRSTFVTIVSLGRLLAAVGLNVYLIAGLGWGIDGFLYANLAVSSVFALGVLTHVVRLTGFAVSRSLLGRMLSFSLPFVPAVAFGAIIHEGDRLILQRFVSLSDVGVYALGYKIAMTASQLVAGPFAQSWGPILYEVRRRPDAGETYASVMRLSTYVSLLVMLAVSVFARETIHALAGPEFQEAYRVIPLVALGYVLFGLNEHLKVPVLLSGRTREIPIVYSITVVVNLALCALLIPVWGVMGAATATLATFVVFVLIALVRYGRCYPIPFPIGDIARAMLVAIGVFALGEAIAVEPLWLTVLVKSALLLGVTAFLFRPALGPLVAGYRLRGAVRP